MNKPIDGVTTCAQPDSVRPIPRDGVNATEDALLILNALDWVRDAAHNHEDFEPLQTLLDKLLPLLRGQVEAARDVLYACQSRLGTCHE
ncbi:hypothetical protein PQQ53_14150 [Paraburkholderia strydomiana]|jgi:hypothetical protein|uniref:hypothetical protein n=1 Tax=Paraburkholderia strydomiana TaxID=1245417 RepID=UPI0038BD2AE9